MAFHKENIIILQDKHVKNRINFKYLKTCVRKLNQQTHTLIHLKLIYTIVYYKEIIQL